MPLEVQAARRRYFQFLAPQKATGLCIYAELHCKLRHAQEFSCSHKIVSDCSQNLRVFPCMQARCCTLASVTNRVPIKVVVHSMRPGTATFFLHALGTFQSCSLSFVIPSSPVLLRKNQFRRSISEARQVFSPNHQAPFIALAIQLPIPAHQISAHTESVCHAAPTIIRKLESHLSSVRCPNSGKGSGISGSVSNFVCNFRCTRWREHRNSLSPS